MDFYSALSRRKTGILDKARPAKFRSAYEQIWVLVAITLLVTCAPIAQGQSTPGPAAIGTWQTLSQLMPINPVHVALMHNGKILVVSGSGNYPAQTTFMVGVWDPSNNTWTPGPNQSWDMFCNGMIVLPDGRPFIIGGNLQYDPFFGWKRTSIYDPATDKWTDMEDMAHGRWYPTATVLGDGRVMTFSGFTETGGTNTQVEIYKVGAGWGAPITTNWTPPLYPRMHVLPNGKVFYSGSQTRSQIFDPSTDTWSLSALTNSSTTRTYGSSVLFPLTPANGYKPKVMIFGGGNSSSQTLPGAEITTEIIDLSASSPTWVYGPNMSQQRIEMNATMLPNGQILAVGGSASDEVGASLQADLYDPATNSMAPAGFTPSAGSNAYPRLYHSVSLLLPDATVWLAGGNPSRGSYQEQVEIYTPPYLYNADGTLATRPSITSVTPGVIGYGTSFQVQTPDAANIASVVIMKNGAVTHAFNMDQRLVGLSFSAGSGVLNVTGPPNGNIAPPGYYMIFLINSAGVPSVAKFVQVLKASTDTPPNGTITSPASDILIAPGQSVTFSGTGTTSSGSITGYSWSFRGGTPATSSLQNPGAVTFSTPGSYTVAFTVTDSAGNTDPSPPVRTITVASQPAPALSAASPNVGAQGKANIVVTLSGSNFLASPKCSFGTGIVVNSCTFNSSTQITANINILSSAATGSRNVTVTNTDSQSSTLTNGFTVQAGTSNPAPTITSVSPNTGAQGKSIVVTITGTNFLPKPACDFGAEQGLAVSACTYNSATKITATVSIGSNAIPGGHNVIVTDTDGQSATASNGFTVTSSGIGLGSGFTAGSMILNGNATISGTALSLTTTNGTFQASGAWYPTAVNIQNFTTDFSFQTSAGSPTADGLTFTLQNQGTTALGGAGGNLGYGLTTTPSVAVKFDLYSNNGEGPDSTGLYLNGASPTTPAVDMTASGVDLHSGHVFKVHMTYDGTTLTMTITDTTNTTLTFTQSWPVNIPSTVGANTAFAGFTGATGGYTSNQNILSWTMNSGTGSGGGTVATPTFNPAAGTYLGTQTVSLSDTTSGATIFYTLDGTQPGTSAGGSTQQYSGPITVTSTKTIQALATATGMTKSATASATYTIESQVAAPTFAPPGANYSSAQSVSISTTTPAPTTIYYTTDGTDPTKSSTRTAYTAPITVSATETVKAYATKSGYFDSTVATAAYTIGSTGGGGISFGSGFTAGSMVLNGNAAITGSDLSLTTTNGTFQASSAWFPTAVNIQNFTTDFSFQTSAGSPTADGLTFTLQNQGTTALGGAGGNLGYGLTTTPSVAVKFDLYSNNGEGPDSTGLYLNGASPTTPAVVMTASGVDLHSGDVFKVHMTYDGTNLAMTITDATTAAKFSITWPVNIPSTVGANTAFAGFTGATGGYTSNQNILSWTMSSGTGSGGGTVATPTFNPAAGTYLGTQTVTLSDTTSGATIFYTLDGTAPGTSAGGSTHQYNSSTPITVSSTETIQALATATGMTKSATASATYTIESQVAAPTFAPPGASYNSAQTVSISTTTAAPTTIYYTTDGTDPTKSSTRTVYTAAITVSATETVKAYATKSGYFDSTVATAAYTIGSTGGGGVAFGSGFSAGSMVLNGNAVIGGTALALTTTSPQFQVASAWFPTALNVQKFTTDFTFQLSAGSPTADGFTFAIQGNSTAAIGGSGGKLGYGNILKSVAVKLDLYNNAGEGTDSTGLYLNGPDPTVPAVDMTSSGVDLHSGHVFSVHIVYDGTNLTMTITDTTNTALTFTQSWPVNIPGTVGANTAFVGFTGGTGGYTANQSVLTWTYTVN